MKKTLFFAAAAALAIFATSCENAPKADLRTDVDTLSYEMGLAYSSQAKGAFEQFQIDSVHMDEYIKGIVDGVCSSDDAKKKAYYMGIIFGMNCDMQLLQNMERELFGNDSTAHLSRKNFVSAIAAAMNDKSSLTINDTTVVTPDMAYELANERIMALRAIQLEKQYAAEKEAGIKFLEENAKNDSVKTLPCGVQYKVIKEGKGELPTATSVVSVKYEGRLINGIVFDKSAKGSKDEPVEFPVNRVIKGWTEALQAMPVGSVWELAIPYELAYGAEGNRNIPPFSTLIFKVELLSIK